MLPKDRIAAAFAHQPTDRIPIYMGGWSARTASYLLGREAWVGYGINFYRDSVAMLEGEAARQELFERNCADAWELARITDVDLVFPTFWRQDQAPTRRLDEYTLYYGDEERGYVQRFFPETEMFQIVDQWPRTEPTLADIERHVEWMEALGPSQPRPEDYPEALAMLAEFGDERALYGHAPWCALPREPAWLAAIAFRPDLMKRYVMAAARNGLPVIGLMASMGMPYLFGGGDFAGNSGPLYSPAAFHEIMLPGLQLISEEARRCGCYHLFASDGNLWPVADDLFGASGVEGYYEIETRAGMDLRRLRERFPHLTLMGGINSYTLDVGTVEEVRREVLEALEVAHDCGSIIVGASNLIVPTTPPENIEMMLTTLHDNR